MALAASGDRRLLAAISHEAHAFSGAFSCYAKNLGTGEELAYNADSPMPAAGAFNLVVMVALYGRALQGELELDRRVTVRGAETVPGLSFLDGLSPGLQLTLEDLCRIMIALGDTLATLKLVALIGPERVNQAARQCGLRETRYVLPVDGRGGPRSHALTTAREFSRLMEMIAEDGMLTPGACAAMRAHLACSRDGDQISRFLPCSPSTEGAEPLAAALNVAGAAAGVRTDTAIIEADGARFIVTALTERSKDAEFHVEHEGAVLNGSVGRLVFDRWAGPAARAIARTYVPLSGRG